jgi:hypothetical protein
MVLGHPPACRACQAGELSHLHGFRSLRHRAIMPKLCLLSITNYEIV